MVKNKYTIFSHSQAEDGISASEVTPMVETENTGAKSAVDQKIAIDKQRSKITYEKMIENADEILFSANTVFPFTFFPSSVVLDRNQLNISVGVFWGVKSYLTFLIKDIKNVVVRKGILFSEVEFEVVGHEKNPPRINYFNNNDAEQVKKIIDSIHIASASQVDITQLEKKEVLNLARKVTYRNNLNNASI